MVKLNKYLISTVLLVFLIASISLISAESRYPLIIKFSPTKGFASGTFEIQFIDPSSSSVTLNYALFSLEKGNYYTKTLQSNECAREKDKHTCKTSINLSQFNGQDITYWFGVSDSAGGSIETRQVSLEVDTMPPVINSFQHTLVRNALNLFFNINDKNFDSIRYIDEKDKIPKLKSLCSSLANGICEAKLILSKGIHKIRFIISDKANNTVTPQPLEFTI